jgi:chromosomal replication initiation ATPase DnaA
VASPGAVVRATGMSSQLTFDLALPPPTYAREDFVVSDGNREALAWLDRWPDWPAPALALSGPPGSGKTHLARIWAKRAAARLMRADDFAEATVPDLTKLADECPAIVIEDADRAAERAMFHLYNLMRERRHHLLLVSPQPPAHWSIHLPDLASRLRAAPAVAVAAPDDELLGSIILKQLADRQLHAAPGVVSYLVSRMERSADAARRIVIALDQRALAERREIDRRLAADVLNDFSDTHSRGQT